MLFVVFEAICQIELENHPRNEVEINITDGHNVNL